MDQSLLHFAGSALIELISGAHLLYLLVGVLVGIVVGILPGLGGISGMALLLPFVYGMEQGHALAMMMGLVSVTTVSDTFPSILMGIPGSAGSQATILDGFPLAKKGQAARALSASFTASLLGGVFGALLLTFSFVIARPLLLAVGFGEQMMLVLIALTLVGMLTGQSAVKGLASCGFGLLLGAVGSAPATAEYRMTFNYIYLFDGVPLVVVALGLFAIPEILDVLRHQRTISDDAGRVGSGWGQGIRDTFANWGLVLRCSAIGALVGALPGLGGTVIEWVSYAHVMQTSKDKSQFGKGDIRGVIAPEAANNAKEGGALIPTLFFGIPGSGTNALLLGGLVMIGLTPGRSLVTEHVDLVYLIIWSLALAHVFGAIICILLARPISTLTRVRYTLIAPFMIVMIVFAAFQATLDWGDIYVAMILGMGGLTVKRFGWSRPAMLIGFVLSKPLEQSLYRTIQVYGFDVLLRPMSLVLLAVAVISGIYAWRNKTKVSDTAGGATLASSKIRRPQILFAAAILLLTLTALWNVSHLRFLGAVFPMTVGIACLVLTLTAIVQIARSPDHSPILYDSEVEFRAEGGEARPIFYYLGWFALLPAMSWVLGFFLAAPLYVFVFLFFMAGSKLRQAVFGALGIALFLLVARDYLYVSYPQGLLEQWVELPYWLI
ncbi:MAG: tripartite tricarboxylate transporter permease [Cypionkella sp.]